LPWQPSIVNLTLCHYTKLVAAITWSTHCIEPWYKGKVVNSLKYYEMEVEALIIVNALHYDCRISITVAFDHWTKIYRM
jgi:hypothetical protein